MVIKSFSKVKSLHVKDCYLAKAEKRNQISVLKSDKELLFLFLSDFFYYCVLVSQMGWKYLF